MQSDAAAVDCLPPAVSVARLGCRPVPVTTWNVRVALVIRLQAVGRGRRYLMAHDRAGRATPSASASGRDGHQQHQAAHHLLNIQHRIDAPIACFHEERGRTRVVLHDSNRPLTSVHLTISSRGRPRGKAGEGLSAKSGDRRQDDAAGLSAAPPNFRLVHGGGEWPVTRRLRTDGRGRCSGRRTQVSSSHKAR